MRPVVDESLLQPKWGLPDLDAIRDFLGVRLGWESSRLDEILVPVLKEMNGRSMIQTTLDSVFSVANPSKANLFKSQRLQRVVSEWTGEATVVTRPSKTTSTKRKKASSYSQKNKC